MYQTVRNVYLILTPSDRRLAFVVLVVSIVAAMFEVAGIASVMPFLKIASDPALIESNNLLSRAFITLGSPPIEVFLLFAGMLTLATVVIATLARIFAIITMARFTNMRRHTISRRLLLGYLRRPYAFFLQRNASELSTLILSEVDQLVLQCVRPALTIITYGFSSLLIFGFLVFIDPAVTTSIAALLILCYGLIFYLMRQRLKSLGQRRKEANAHRFKITTEAFRGIEEIKVKGYEGVFFDSYDPASRQFSRTLSSAEIVNKVPKRIIELLGFSSIILTATYLVGRHDSIGDTIALLGVYALAGVRLLPALQEIYQGFARLRFGAPVAAQILSELPVDYQGRRALSKPDRNRFAAEKCIELKDISYTYPASSDAVLSNVSMAFPAKSSVAIVGATGSGKSTLIKILVGLLTPSSGSLQLDGTVMTSEQREAWRASIGYVPQTIFLTDDTVRHNIALGASPDTANEDAIMQAARVARIHDFIVNDLPDGYDTRLGDNGIRLSGGQRQRLAIARALYSQPEVLILDEASSALDSETELRIFQSLLALPQRPTVIAITHHQQVAELFDHCYRLSQHGVTPC